MRFATCVWALALALPCATAAATPLPRLMSTNICADVLALSLAEPAQIVSLSRHSQDAQRFSMAAQARRFAANEATAEDVLYLQPDLVLASRRWNARHQQALFKRHGVRIVTVPFPTDWEGIDRSTLQMGRAMGREAAAQQLLADTRGRRARLQAVPRPFNALYLRPNGGSAGVGTHVDAVLAAAGLRNHAAALGLKGWGRVDLERILHNPPDVFVTPSMVNDLAYARSGLSRHPQMKALLERIPVVALQQNDWGCSNWQLIEAAEAVAAQVDALQLSEKRP
jgi:iron complex transport system substrate-binding protein